MLMAWTGHVSAAAVIGCAPCAICLVYDCLFPYTVGGAERWYRNLAERLAADGHEVTYLTLRQWDRGDDPRRRRASRVVAVGPRLALYTRVRPPPDRAAARLRRRRARHLLRHGRRYDVVHTASFPYFSLLAAGLLRPRGRLPAGRRLARGVDARVLARVPRARPAAGSAGAVQRACVRIPQRAFCFSRLHAARLRAEGAARRGDGARGRVRRATLTPRPSRCRPGLVVFAGRHIPEKRVPALVPAIAPRAASPELRAEIFGDGPERGAGAGADPRARPRSGRVSAPGLRRPRAGRRRAPARALPGAALAARGLRAGRRRGVRGRARPRSSSPTPTTRRSSWSRRASTASSRRPRRRRTSPPRSCGCARRARRCAPRRPRGTRPTRAGCRWTESLERVAAAYRGMTLVSRDRRHAARRPAARRAASRAAGRARRSTPS